MNVRPEVIDPIVSAGCELFQSPQVRFPGGVPKYNVLAWLFAHCADHGLQLNVLERDRVVGKVHSAANKVLDFTESHALTVAQLRDLLPSLPDNMPVLYQRIEDVLFEKCGWKAVPLTWDTHEPYEGELEFVRTSQPALVDIVERDGKTLVRELSDYIPASGAYVTADDNGDRALCIHAHY